MRITEKIHALKIPFQVPIAPGTQLDRFVYVYLLLGETITLLDSGVAGAEQAIFDYILSQGRKPAEIARIILSHSHPDHIGAAAAIKAAAGCQIWAHAAEKDWIENPEQQFQARPVPGFHGLVDGAVAVDRLLADGEILDLGRELECQIIHTPGHSRGSISLYFRQQSVLFSGDAILLPNDLPTYEDMGASIASINKLAEYRTATILLSSWEEPLRGQAAIDRRIKESLAYLRNIDRTVREVSGQGITDRAELCRHVVNRLGLPPLAANPLTARALSSSLTFTPD